jgi:hypothetical protein
MKILQALPRRRRLSDEVFWFDGSGVGFELGSYLTPPRSAPKKSNAIPVCRLPVTTSLLVAELT